MLLRPFSVTSSCRYRSWVMAEADGGARTHTKRTQIYMKEKHQLKSFLYSNIQKIIENTMKENKSLTKSH